MAMTTEVPLVARGASHGGDGSAADLPGARQTEIEHALERVDEGSGAILWTAEHGMGRSTLLDTLAEALTATAASARALVVRVSPERLDRDRSRDAFLAALLSQVERLSDTGEEDLPVERGLEAAIAAQLRKVAAGKTCVILIDDADMLSGEAIDSVLQLLGHDGSATVVLATACRSPFGERPPHDVEIRELPGVTTDGALRVMAEAHCGAVAPHVAATLTYRLAGNPACIVQTARRLSPQQLAGTSMLPDPLPVVPAVKNALAAHLEDLTDRDRAALLIGAVAVVDRIDTLTAATGEDVNYFVSGPVAKHLTLLAGGFSFEDQRLRSLLHGQASLAQRTTAHEALARAHQEAGEHQVAAWHTALARIAGDPAVVPDLLRLAVRHLHHGDTRWAHAIAREAVGHATGDERVRACELSGIAAVLSGHIHDAAHWLPHAARSGDPTTRARTLLGLVVTLTLTDGRVPDEVLERARVEAIAGPDDESGRRVRSNVARALSAAACLHMERGATAAAWRRLEEARELVGGGRCGDRDGTRLARAWLSIYAAEATGEVDLPAQAVVPDDESLGAVARGVALMHADEPDAAARLLASAVAELSPVRRSDVWFDGPEGAASPLVVAHLRVVQALVEFRAGDVERAASTLREAAEHLPVGLVLSGLGVTLSRRIDVVRDGAVSATSEALTETSPCHASTQVRLGLLVDRAIEASFDRDHVQAATLLEVAAERELRESAAGLTVPGIDIVEEWATAGRNHEAHRALHRLRARIGTLSPLSRAVVLSRAELAIATEEDIESRVEAATAAARDITSAYDRARSELSVGRAFARVGLQERAEAAMLSAQDLFDESGADAWVALVREEAASLSSGATEPMRRATEVSEHVSPAGTDSASREDADAWAVDLTDREREVATLVAQGYANRDVAERLYVSVRTVEVHLGRVYRKLGLRSRVELAVLAHRYSDSS